MPLTPPLGDYMVKDFNPEFVTSRRSTDKVIATKCRLCGGQLTWPPEAKKGVHEQCIKNYKSKTYGAK
tara:strand:- start:11270 stop:11473 length:204 start_codon:yes stop_codon:yes gene_type:complete